MERDYIRLGMVRPHTPRVRCRGLCLAQACSGLVRSVVIDLHDVYCLYTISVVNT